MAGMIKVVSVWSGWAGSPGFTNFYFSPDSIQNATHVQAVQARVKTFWGAVSTCLPSGVTITIEQDSQIIDSSTGVINDTISAATAQTTTAGAGPAPFAAIAGACIIWRTATFIAGRQLKGKTFVVPMANSAYDTDGTILAGRLADLRAAAIGLGLPGAFPVEERLVAWHRPVGGTGGSATTVSSTSVNDRVAYLKSRRA
jgi:hypothetical protein